MGRITHITNDIWSDEAIQDLPDESYVALYFRLLLNESCNQAGYYRLNVKHLATDVGLGMDELKVKLEHKTSLWKYDEFTNQVLIPTYLKYNVARSEKQLMAVNALVRQLKICDLHLEFIKSLEKYSGVGAVGCLDRSILREVYKMSAKDREAKLIIESYIV